MRTNEPYWETYLDTTPLENILEQFDVTPHEAFEVLISSGLIDEELLKEMLGVQEIYREFDFE